MTVQFASAAVVSAPAIETRGLTKDYGSGHGVFDLNISVARGQVFGFIGANGAGKSTLLKLITGTTQPTIGSVQMTGRVAAMLCMR